MMRQKRSILTRPSQRLKQTGHMSNLDNGDFGWLTDKIKSATDWLLLTSPPVWLENPPITPTADHVVGLILHCVILSTVVLGTALVRLVRSFTGFVCYVTLHYFIYRGGIRPIYEDNSDLITRASLEKATVVQYQGLRLVLVGSPPLSRVHVTRSSNSADKRSYLSITSSYRSQSKLDMTRSSSIASQLIKSSTSPSELSVRPLGRGQKRSIDNVGRGQRLCLDLEAPEAVVENIDKLLLSSSINGSCSTGENSSCAASMNGSCTAGVNRSCAESMNGSCTTGVNSSCAASMNGSCTAGVNSSCAESMNGSCAESMNGSCTAWVHSSCEASMNGSCTARMNRSCAKSMNSSCTAGVKNSCAASMNGSCTTKGEGERLSSSEEVMNLSFLDDTYDEFDLSLAGLSSLDVSQLD